MHNKLRWVHALPFGILAGMAPILGCSDAAPAHAVATGSGGTTPSLGVKSGGGANLGSSTGGNGTAASGGSTGGRGSGGTAQSGGSPSNAAGGSSAGGTSNAQPSGGSSSGGTGETGGGPPIVLTDFRMRRKLTLPQAVPSGLTDFPVLVSLPAGTVGPAEGGANGEVVRFADAQGVALAFEIEAWDPAGVSSVWVRLPDLTAAKASGFYVYYGNPNVTALAANHGESVWSNAYDAVWHFSEMAKDSTLHHYHGAEVQAAFTPGPSGQALLLDNADPNHGDAPASPKYVQLKKTPLAADAPGATVSAWVRHKGPVNSNQAIVLGVGTDETDGHLSRISVALSTGLGLIGEFNPAQADYYQVSSDDGIAPNDQWHYITVVGDIAGKTIALYVDGLPQGAPMPQPWLATKFPSTPSDRIVIGGEEDLSHGFFDGSIDELRVERVVRSAAWIGAQAKAALPDFVSIGPAQAP